MGVSWGMETPLVALCPWGAGGALDAIGMEHRRRALWQLGNEINVPVRRMHQGKTSAAE